MIDKILSLATDIYLTLPMEEAIDTDFLHAITKKVVDDIGFSIGKDITKDMLPLLSHLVICEYIMLLELLPKNNFKDSKEIIKIKLGDGEMAYSETTKTEFFTFIQNLQKQYRAQLIATFREVTW